MKKFVLILSVTVVFSLIFSIDESFGENKICKPGFELIYKATTHSPACVKPSTAEKLVLRGWGVLPDPSQDPNNENGSIHQIIPTDTEHKKIIDANNQFTFDFYDQVRSNGNENIFFSPWSISTAFAIAYEGAGGTAAEEISEVFGFLEDSNERRSGFKSVNDKLNEKDAKYKLQVANALWIAEQFEPSKEYVDTAKNFYDSEVSNVDFITDDGVNKINQWAAQKTEDKIKNVIALGSTNELTRLYITNAIYFKGTWVTQFEKENTFDQDFWIDDSKNIKVPMMTLYESPFNYTKTDELQILEMPYEGDKLSMMILLPNKTIGLNTIEESLDIDKLNEWKSMLSTRQVKVVMPKFELETKYNLKPELIAMGMPTPFSAGPNNFPGITQDEDLYISAAIHKAFVDVNEEGTEAAAVTAIGIGTTSVSIPTYEIFIADHPFIFIIHDTETGNILFMGRIANPS